MLVAGSWQGLHTSLDPCHTRLNNHKLLARGATAQRRHHGLDVPCFHGSPALPKAPLVTKERTYRVPMGAQRGAQKQKKENQIAAAPLLRLKLDH